jgi:glycosyltransferase involved in cell wall biosynthesis
MSSNAPLVSVIIPCFNHGQYLHEAIGSVKASTLKDFEVIIVDDGSTDQTTLAVYDTAVIEGCTLIRKVNEGLAAARNTGIAASKGKYILPLDADDRISTTYLEEASAVLAQRPEVKIVYCKAEYFDGRAGEWHLPDFDLQTMLTQNLIFCTAMYRRSDFDNTIGYNPNMVYGFEDWDFWISMLENGGEVFRLPKVHFFYRVKAGSMVRSLDADKFHFLRRQVYLNHLPYYAANFTDPINQFFELQHFRPYKDAFHTIEHSLDYRIGKALLAPLRFIKRTIVR